MGVNSLYLQKMFHKATQVILLLLAIKSTHATKGNVTIEIKQITS